MNTLWGKFGLSAIDGFCSPGIKTIILIADVIQVGEIEGRVYSAWPATVCACMAVRQNQKNIAFVSYIFHKMTFDSSSMPQSSYFSHRWRLSLYTDERGGAPLIGHFLRCARGK